MIKLRSGYIMTNLSAGLVRFILETTVSGAGGAVVVNLQPPEGKQWRILYAVGSHNDAGDRDSQWYLTTPAGTGGLTPGIALAPGVMLALGALAGAGNTQCLGPLKATRGRYYSFVFNASAAAKTGYVRAVVEEYGGINQS